MTRQIVNDGAAPLVLASASPRRQQLCTALGLSFSVQAADSDETPRRGEPPIAYVRRVTLEKAQTVAALQPQAVVISGDTSVVLGRRILGKPDTPAACAAMIKALRGKRHKVISAVCVWLPDGTHLLQHVVSHVWMRHLSDTDVAHYVATQAWQGAAGGYKIQTPEGLALVKKLHGSPSAVVGLPVDVLVPMLQKAGVHI